MSNENECHLPLNLPALYHKKGIIVTLSFVYIQQLSNARGCPFIKIWFNGSIRTSFTESYKIKQCLPHRPIRATIFVYYSWTASYIKQPIYVGFSKTGSDTTIEPNFDERTASDPRHLKVGGYKQKNQSDNKMKECSFFCFIKLANLGGEGNDFF